MSELKEWLQRSFVDFCKASSQPVPFSGLRINPALGMEEAKYFILGLETGLFQPDESGNVQSELLPSPRSGKRICQIFSCDPLPPRLVRERICQLSTTSLLVVKRGWLTNHIQLEPDLKNDREMPYGIDILVKSRTGEILACVEVKRSTAELRKLVLDLRACCKRGPHAQDECGFPQNHLNYEFCASYRPFYFWAVAPDAEICFRMRYGNGSIELEQLASLPPRSLMESS